MFKDLIKQERLPTVWCGGCNLGVMLREIAKVFDELGFNNKNTVVVSGIGCSGRIAGYFNLDTAHGAHGRAIPLAEGIKLFNDNLNVVVISGDGDLMGIGGNHLLHSSRRNTNITVICNSNEIYGMTGGQMSPMTKEGVKTLTSPDGNKYKPLNVQGLIKASNCFFARTTAYHIEHMNNVIKQAILHKGFSFVDIKGICITNNGKRLGFKDAYEMLIKYKDYKIKNNEILKDNEIGIV